MSADFYETKWFFGMLNYEHWRVYHLGVEVALLVVNTEDRTCHIQPMDDVNADSLADIPRQFLPAYRWARIHEREY